MTNRFESGFLASERRRFGFGLLVALVCVTIPFLEVLIGTRTIIFGDNTSAYVPRYIAMWANIRHGVSPFWWRNMFGGFDTLSAGQSAIFYLPNAIFGWLSPIQAYRWWFFGHLWVMTLGWYTWSWRRWHSTLGATVSGIAGSISGYLVFYSVFMPYVAALALVPWMFVMLDRVMQSPRVRYVAALAALIAAMAFQLTQFLWITLIALGVCAIFGLSRRGVGLAPWIRVGAATLLGVGLGAIQLLPLMEFSETSVRPKLTKTGAFEFSTDPSHLLSLAFPNINGGPLHSTAFDFLGITLVALAVVGAVHLRRDRLGLALMTLAGLGLLTAMGGHTFVGGLTFDLVPFANRFRGWTRNLLWINVAVAMLAGAGAREVARMPRAWAMRLLATAAGAGVMMLLLPALTDLGDTLPSGGEGTRARFIPVVLLLALGGAAMIMTRSKIVGAAMLVAVCTLELGAFVVSGPWRAESLEPSEVSATFNNSPPPFGAAADAAGGLDRWVSDVPDASAFWPSVIGHQSQSVNGYDPLLQADYSRTVGVTYVGYMPVHDFWQGGWLPDIFRVTTLVASNYAGDIGPGWSFSRRYDFPPDAPRTTPPTDPPIDMRFHVYTYVPRLPESYLIGATRFAPLEDTRAAVKNPTTDLTQFAYVDFNTIPNSTAQSPIALNEPGMSGSVTSGAMNDGGSGSWSVTASRPSLFVTSYAWMKGWHATVDGKSVPVVRTNAVVLGVPVPAGTHTVHLSYTPPGWIKGRNVAVASLLALIGILVVAGTPLGSWAKRRLPRRKPQPNSSPRIGSD